MIPGIKAFPITRYDWPIVSLTTYTTPTITLPTVQANDIAVLLDAVGSGGSSTPSTVVASGFISLADSTHSLATFRMRMIASYKKCIGNEGGTNVTGMNGTTNDGKILLVFRPPLTTVTTGSWIGNVDGGGQNPPAQTISAAGVSGHVLALAWKCNFGAGGTTGFTVETPPFQEHYDFNDVTSQTIFHSVGWSFHYNDAVDYLYDTDAGVNANGLIGGYFKVT